MKDETQNMNRHERRAHAARGRRKEKADLSARRRQRLREIARLAKVNPEAAAEARIHEDQRYVLNPAIEHASNALARLTKEQQRRALVSIVGSRGGTIQWL